MYLSFYRLAVSPFQISTDPRFLWLGEKHMEALALLQYTIEENKGFALLTGDVGTGKTTVVNSLLGQIGSAVRSAVITDPALNQMDFFRLIARQFDIEKEFASKGEFLQLFSGFLHQAHRHNQRVLLIIDEAQRLDQTILEEIRLLSNIERPDTKLINIVFVGQDELNAVLNAPASRAIRQRITMLYHLDPLTPAETAAYIGHRLTVAGGQVAIFNREAIAAVARYTRGYPRLINILCDQSLLTGFARQQYPINADMVAECARDLALTAGRARGRAPSMALPPAPSPATRGESLWTRPLEGKTALVAVICIVSGLFVGLKALLTDPSVPAERGFLPQGMVVGTIEKVAPAPDVEKTAVPAQPEAIPPEPDPAAAAAPPEPDPAVTAAPPADRMPGDVADEDVTAAAQTTVEPLFISFDRNSARPGDAALAELDHLAAVTRDQALVQFLVKGYTDAAGLPEYNRWLSQQRADAVKARLIAQGIDPSRITAYGMGPAQEQDATAGKPDRQFNRRVVIEIVAPVHAVVPATPRPGQ